MLGRFLITTITMFGLAVAGDAHANPYQPDRAISTEAEVGVFAQQTPEEELVSLSPVLRVGLRVRDEVELRGSFGAVTKIANDRQTQSAETLGRPSNIYVGTRFLKEQNGKHEKYRFLHGGFGFALPTGYAENLEDQDMYDYAIGGRGGWNTWEWEPDTLGIVVPLGWRAQILRRMVLGVDLGAAGMFSSYGNPKPPGVGGQAAGQLRYAFRRLIAVGVRIQAVYNGRNRDDRFQSSVVPFIDTNFCRRRTGPRLRPQLGRDSADCPVFATASFVVNLDKPYGFGQDEDARGIWGLLLGLGWALY